MSEVPPTYAESILEDIRDYNALEIKYNELNHRYQKLTTELSKSYPTISSKRYSVRYFYSPNTSTPITITCSIKNQVLWEKDIHKVFEQYIDLANYMSREYNIELLHGEQFIQCHQGYITYNIMLIFVDGYQQYIYSHNRNNSRYAPIFVTMVGSPIINSVNYLLYTE